MLGRLVPEGGDHRLQRVVSYIWEVERADWGMAGSEMALEIGGARGDAGRAARLGEVVQGLARYRNSGSHVIVPSTGRTVWPDLHRTTLDRDAWYP